MGKTGGNLGRTLEQLEGDRWGPPDYDSHLVETCHRLRNKPIGEFTAEELRIMIGQNIGLKHLAPLALRHLEQEPLASGDLYEGALLSAVLRSDNEFWRANPDLAQRVQQVIGRLDPLPEDLAKEAARFNAS